MRLAMVAQWLRAAASDPALRRTALRMAAGVSVVQVLWLARVYLLDDAAQFWTFFVLAALELLVPVWGEAAGKTPWHPHHIAERYGLFTLLLLGESLLASANAIFDALGEGEHVPELVTLAISGIVVTAGIWWVYFAREQHSRLEGRRSAFRFGYLHYAIFAAVGAVSAGVEVEIDEITGHTSVSPVVAGLALTLPIAIVVAGAWLVLLRASLARWASGAVLVGAVLIALSGLLPSNQYVVAAALLVGVVVVLEIDGVRATSPAQVE
jgi:low temperature requirement protein LtrA